MKSVVEDDVLELVNGAPGKPHSFAVVVTDQDFDFSSIPGLEVVRRLKGHWLCRGNKRSVEALRTCRAVSRVFVEN